MLLKKPLLVSLSIATLEAAAPSTSIDSAALAAPLLYSPPSLGNTVIAYLLDWGALNELGEFLEQNDGFPNLHLEKYTFQEEPELGFGAFKSLLKHGYYKYVSKEILLKGLCGQGKLEHLKFLLSSLSDESIVPSSDDFKSAAAKGHWNILEWGLQEGLIAKANQRSIAIALAASGHAGHFRAWLGMTRVKFDKYMIEEILKTGTPRATKDALSIMGDPEKLLQHLLGRNKLDKLASTSISALETLLEVLPSRKFKGLEGVSELRANKIRTDKTLHSEGLVHDWPENIEFLQQISEMDDLEESERIKILEKNACTKEAMEWLKSEKGLCPDNLNWAYIAGDWEAIDWAKENCPSTPHTKENFEEAVKQGHVKIVEKVDVDQLRKNEVWLFKYALDFGRLKTFDCLRERITPIETRLVFLSNVSADQHLPILERALNNGYAIHCEIEIPHAASYGDLKTVKWLIEKFPNFLLFYNAHQASITSDHHEIYMFFRQNFPKKVTSSLTEDFQKAYCNGSLNIVKVIVGMNRSAISEPPVCSPDVPKSRYCHVVEWLEANVFNKAPQSLSDAFSEMKIN